MHLEAAKRIYESELRPMFGAPVGAAEAEINNVEQIVGRPLPAAYREFLAWMGSDLNGIFRGTECFIDDLPDNIKWLPEFFDECGVLEAYLDSFVCFWSHQGYIAVWFDASDNVSDPPCWGMSDVDKKVEAMGPFSSFIERCVRDFAKGTGSLRGAR